MGKMKESIYTTCLEVFHSVKVRYLPHKKKLKMITGAQLAALGHNHNTERIQVFLSASNKNKKPKRFENSQLLRKTLHVN